ncbi:MAG: phosphate ABC transporter ATP-binding protein [Nitrospinae bacterium]|nr:phosphate ABC transporter ATP-binding protein [Nitrospinota bacterium]
MNTKSMTTNPVANVMPGNNKETENEKVIDIKDVKIKYSGVEAIKGVSLSIPKNEITAIIGPSGCGKSTLLRSINRMNDFVPGATVEGQILYHGIDLYGKDVDPVEVRRKIGMVFQKPNPFPKSIFDNVAWGPLINGYKNNIYERVEKSLQQAALWDEVKDRLKSSAMTLSGGQQQRLCIARTLAMEPEVILMDEPCSALDPVSTASIEDLMFELKQQYTLIIVTHNMQQASRASKYTAFFESGDLVEFGETENIFTVPKNKRTEDYVTGRFG